LGGWPVLEGKGWTSEDTFKWWELNYKMYKMGYDTDFLFELDIDSDDKNTSWRVLKMDEATLSLEREYLVKGFEDKDVQEYYKFMVDAAILLGAEPEYAKAEMKESLLFEISLAHVTTPKEERRNETLLYNPTTIEALPHLDGFPPSWTDYIQNILLDVNNVTVYGFEKIIVANLTYFEKLSNLLTNTKPRVLANYLVWPAVKNSLKYLNEEAQNIKQRFDKAILGIQVLPPIWKRCTKEVGFDNSKSGLRRLGDNLTIHFF
jgi:membrane metallo-endopeptidase-like protein 1